MQLVTNQLGPSWSAAFAYPIRIALLAELVEVGVATAQGLADAVEVPVSVARYHLARLELLHLVMRCAAPEGAGSRVGHFCLPDRETTVRALACADENVRLSVPDRSLRGEKGRRLVRLGETLRSAREQQGVAVPTLAARAGLLPAVLERIEAGQADPRVTVLFRLWESLGLSAAEALSSEQVA